MNTLRNKRMNWMNSNNNKIPDIVLHIYILLCPYFHNRSRISLISSIFFFLDCLRPSDKNRETSLDEPSIMHNKP